MDTIFFYLGKFFYEGSIDSGPEYLHALKMFLKADALNNKYACEYLAQMYFYGKGTPIDKQKSAIFYEKAAHYSNLEAQYKLGIMYMRGIGVKRDYLLAKKCLVKATMGGYEIAQYMVGLLFLFGKGVEQDLNEAKAWFERAAFLDILISGKDKANLSTWAIHCLTDTIKKII